MVTLQDPLTKSQADIWSVDYGVSLAWYLEDRLSLDLTATGLQQGTQGGIQFARTDGISVALSYKLAGRLDAPGLMPAIQVP